MREVHNKDGGIGSLISLTIAPLLLGPCDACHWPYVHTGVASMDDQRRKRVCRVTALLDRAVPKSHYRALSRVVGPAAHHQTSCLGT